MLCRLGAAGLAIEGPCRLAAAALPGCSASLRPSTRRFQLPGLETLKLLLLLLLLLLLPLCCRLLGSHWLLQHRVQQQGPALASSRAVPAGPGKPGGG